jgi:hypothetical protein
MKGTAMAKKKNGRDAEAAAPETSQDQPAVTHPSLEAAHRCGLDPSTAAGWLNTFGPDVVDAAVRLVENGLSMDWVAETVDKLGGDAVRLIGGLFRGHRAAAAAPGELRPAENVGPHAGGLFDKKQLFIALITEAVALAPSITALSGPALVVVEANLKAILQILQGAPPAA